jgi:hypothetical protein
MVLPKMARKCPFTGTLFFLMSVHDCSRVPMLEKDYKRSSWVPGCTSSPLAMASNLKSNGPLFN